MTRHPHLLWFAPLLVAAALELFALWPHRTTLDTSEQVWTLSPRDLSRAPNARGLWRAGLSGLTITREAHPERWLTHAPPHELQPAPGLPAPWRRVAFPQSEGLPSLADATVEISAPNAPDTFAPCPKKDGEFQCDTPSWAHIGERDGLTIAGKKERCIWAHPIETRTTRIAYPPFITEGLLLEAAFMDSVTTDRPSQVTALLTQGDTSQETTLSIRKRGWTRLPLTASSTPTPLTLTLRASASGRHQLCYRFRHADAPSPPR